MVKATPKTPEEIQAMEDEVRAYRADEARSRADAARDQGKALADLVDSDGFKAMVAALPSLQRLAVDAPEIFPKLGVFVTAVENGVEGLVQLRGFIPPVVDPAGDAPAAP